jgi:hypothetical protein
VELNMMCLVKGFENFNNGECVAYHYESQTRNDDPKNMEKLEYDYKNNLLPSVGTYFDRIKSKINII